MKRNGQIKRKMRLSPVSKRRKEELKEYSRLRKEFLGAHPVCGVWFCETYGKDGGYDLMCDAVRRGEVANPCPATEVHHKARRGKNYLNTNTWMAVSSRNHKRIEGQSTYDGKPYGMKWARENRFLF